MHKSEAPCPSELTTISAEALNDTNILNIFISLQKNSIELRIRLAVERVLKGRPHVMAEGIRLTGITEKPKTTMDLTNSIGKMFDIRREVASSTAAKVMFHTDDMILSGAYIQNVSLPPLCILKLTISLYPASECHAILPFLCMVELTFPCLPVSRM